MFTRHSPCVGICSLDGISGFCLGCGRSRDEIGDWMTMNEAQRDAVWLTLPRRLTSLNVGVRLLPWTSGEIIGFVAETLTQRLGSWSIGAALLSAVFPAAGQVDVKVEASGDTVIATTATSAFRVRVTDKVRAFGFAGSRRIALILPKGRAKLAPDTGALGLTDCDAIDEGQRGQRIHTLDSTDQNLRVAIRSADFSQNQIGAVDAWRTSFATRDWSSLPDGATIVWETAIARIEVRAASIGQQADFPLHVDARAASSRPQDPSLPSYAADVATFHPQNRLDG